MHTLKIALIILLAVISVCLTVIVLLQEGQDAGLGSISGMADSYWSKNKSRAIEGRLVMITRVLGALFLIIIAVLNLSIFA